MFKELKEINTRPKPFEFYTAEELWTNEHTAKQMLSYHLNESIDVSTQLGGLFNNGGTGIKPLVVGHQEYGLNLPVEFSIHQCSLKLVFKVRHGPQSAQYAARVLALGEIR